MAVVIVAATSSFATADSDVLVDNRVTFNWHAQQPQHWHIRLAVVDSGGDRAADGRIDEVANDCQSEASTGAFVNSDDLTTLSILPRKKMLGGSIRFRLQAPASAQLAVYVQSDTATDVQTSAPTKLVPLRDILSGTPIQTAGDHVQWSLQRQNEDRLRIDLQQTPAIHLPGSEFSCEFRCNTMTDLASRMLVLHYALYQVGTGKIVSEKRWPVAVDAYGNAKPVVLREAAPGVPGVYEIRCWLENDENLWSRFRRKDQPLAYAGKPIVVLPEGDTAAEARQAWATVGEIRPSQAAAWQVGQWLPESTNRLIPGSEPQQELPEGKHAGEEVSLIPPRGTFQAMMPVRTPGFPHQVTVRYRASRETRLKVDVTKAGSAADPSLSFLLVDDSDAGDEDGFRVHTFVHYPQSEDQIRLTNLDTENEVAFESIVVRAGPRRLVPMTSNQNHHRLAILQLTDFSWVESLSADALQRNDVASCQQETMSTYQLWVAANRLSGYAAACGMNAVSIPAVSGGRTWFSCHSFQALRSPHRIDSSALDIVLALMDRTDLKIYLSVDPRVPLASIETMLRDDPQAAEQLLDGRRNDDKQHVDRYNSLHPSVQRAVTDLLGEVNGHAVGHSCYAGIALQTGLSSHVRSIDQQTINDSTLALFAASAAVKTVSLAQLRRWIGEQGQSTFRQWLQAQAEQLYQAIATKMGEHDLLLLPEPGAHPIRGELAGGIAEISPRLIRVRNICRVPVGSLSDRMRFQQTFFTEDTDAAGGVADQAVCLSDLTPPGSTPAALFRHRTARDVRGTMDRFNPPILMFRLTDVTGSLSAELAQTLAVFTALPQQAVAKVESADPAEVVGLRSGIHDGHRLLMITNHAPWSSEVEVDCGAEIKWRWIDGSDANEHGPATVASSGTKTTVTLPAGRMVALKSLGTVQPKSKLVWTSRVAGGQKALDNIKRDVSTVVARLGILTDLQDYPVLSNGGFEQRGGVGLVGWLHAQHPPDSVRLDDTESIEGDRSVLLTTDARSSNRSWLVSETFKPPETGRLAVSLACRGEMRTGSSGHRIRVSIEGTQSGQPLRRSQEFTVPQDGKWQSRQVILEVDGMKPSAVKSLRLTLDSLSTGRVWIDDVHLHDRFPLTKERGHLQSQAFLAVQGLQRGNLTASARLLQNHWAQFLLNEAAAQIPPPTTDNTTDTTTETADQQPGVAQRLRSWLPRPLRF